jgi:hypothetical protein
MPSLQVGTYPTVEGVLTFARAIINDQLRNNNGQILTDNASFSLDFVNMAIAECQETLANNGVSTQIVDNVILTPIPPTPNHDPNCQIFIGYNGYFDGNVQHATPVLPPDLIVPLRIWQRQAGSAGQFYPVHPAADGLQSSQPGSTFGPWEWRQGAIYMVGCTQTQDLRIRYEQSLLDLTTNVGFNQQTIFIPQSRRALGFLVAKYYGFARGSQQVAQVQTMAEEAMNQIINRQIRADQRNPIRPPGYRSGGGSIDGSLGGSYR